MMDYNLLSPVSDILVDDIKLSHFQTLGRKLKIHTHTIKPDLEGINIAILGVLESRNSIIYLEQTLNIIEISFVIACIITICVLVLQKEKIF